MSERMDSIDVNEKGGKQSAVSERCDLLPPRALLAAARVLAQGAAKYGEENWRLLPVKDHVNHAIRHLLLSRTDDTSEPHLEHAACRILFALDEVLRAEEAQQQDTGSPTVPFFIPDAAEFLDPWLRPFLAEDSGR